MTTPNPAAPAGAASQQALINAALVLLQGMGLTPEDLAAISPDRPAVPTFAEYVPVVSTAVSDGTRRAYGTYWNRVLDQWGTRRLDEPTPSDIRQLMAYVKANIVVRRNSRGGRSAEEHLVAALRCVYQCAVDDGLIRAADNLARKVAKPRRLPSTRRALPDDRLAQAPWPVTTIVSCRRSWSWPWGPPWRTCCTPTRWPRDPVQAVTGAGARTGPQAWSARTRPRPLRAGRTA